jgi:CheY-like chemotaxis protein/two-component sensor histidine kinase
LINDVLDISRIVSGKLHLETRACDLREVIAAAVEVVHPAAEAKNIRIEVDLDPMLGRISCDPTRMQQVVWNLLSNAIKFTPKGGTVSVRTAQQRSSARIQVTDTGQGIAPDFLPHVFDRFRQADSSTRRKIGGLGLGLSITKQLVEMHGGTVKAQSEGEGKGATFTMTLPIAAVASTGESDTEHTPESTDAMLRRLQPPRLDGLRIVIVDDEADARRVVSRILSDAGAIVMSAANVPEALRGIESLQPHVLVSDIAMPDEDGYDLIHQVRNQGITAQQLPAIALTAFAAKEYSRGVLLAGYQVHVPKPVDPVDLLAVVASLAGRTGTAGL